LLAVLLVGGAAVLAAITDASSSGSPSGESMPVGNPPGWRLVFSDDFTRDVRLGNFPRGTNGKWGAYPNGWSDTSGNGTYNCTKVCSVHNGVLDLWIHSEGGVHYGAVPYPRIPGGNNFRYGRYAVRFRSDPVPGYKTAWLLWPESDVWPRDGEIDFPEGNLDGPFCAFIHFQGATQESDQTSFCPSGATYNAWHTAVIEWRSGRVSFILDGRTVGGARRRVPTTPMHWVLQTETQVDASQPSASAAGHVQVDWVAVYRPA
jgi:beta-glucanase (GH16 family)